MKNARMPIRYVIPQRESLADHEKRGRAFVFAGLLGASLGVWAAADWNGAMRLLSAAASAFGA